MKKQKWTEKPITWGGYAVLCAVVYAISLVVSAVMYIVYARPAWWSKLTTATVAGFKNIREKVSGLTKRREP